MAYTYEELHDKTVAQLREICEEMGDVAELHGHSTMHKEQLLPLICQVLGIEAHVHHEVVGIDKKAFKARIRELKNRRDELLAAGSERDHLEYKRVLREINDLKGKIRRATI
jgi:hypothetical protein